MIIAISIGQYFPQFSCRLNFHETIFQESTFKSTDREVQFTLKKQKKCWWPRLTATPQKPAWLKVHLGGETKHVEIYNCCHIF